MSSYQHCTIGNCRVQLRPGMFTANNILPTPNTRTVKNYAGVKGSGPNLPTGTRADAVNLQSTCPHRRGRTLE